MNSLTRKMCKKRREAGQFLGKYAFRGWEEEKLESEK